MVWNTCGTEQVRNGAKVFVEKKLVQNLAKHKKNNCDEHVVNTTFLTIYN
jgi:hypothetical protein